MTATHAGNQFIAGSARTQLSVISCHGCTAPKGCCHHRVTAWLHEGVPIAQRLRHEQRDTPALRDALRDAAVLMARRDSAYSRPCVFHAVTARISSVVSGTACRNSTEPLGESIGASSGSLLNAIDVSLVGATSVIGPRSPIQWPCPNPAPLVPTY